MTATSEPTFSVIIVDQAVTQLRAIAVSVDDANAKQLQDLATALDEANRMVEADRAQLATELAERLTPDDLQEAVAGARRTERANIAQLLEDNATTVATFAADAEQLVAMLAFMLRLGTGE